MTSLYKSSRATDLFCLCIVNGFTGYLGMEEFKLRFERLLQLVAFGLLSNEGCPST